MNLPQLSMLEAKIARARQLLAEQKRRVRVDQPIEEVAKARELLHDLGYWLHKLEASRERLLRLGRHDKSADAPSARTDEKNAA